MLPTHLEVRKGKLCQILIATIGVAQLTTNQNNMMHASSHKPETA
jgi:hypothetical protein